MIKGNKVICDSCGWSWNLSEGGDDKYTCHKCGHNNTPAQSNIDKIFDHFGKFVSEQYKPNLNNIKNFIVNYINKSGINVKYLEACSSFKGVRTKDQVIICSPQFMDTLGDFLYTIFHEIRHEQQIGQIKMDNPLVDYDLEDFESLYKQYWEMELDADQFAKNMVAKLVIASKLPIDVAKKALVLSQYVQNYPSYSKMVEMSLHAIINNIKDMKKRGEEFNDIQDLPLVKQHIDKLQNLL